MYGFALPNIAGLQLDFTLRVFGVWFLAGLFLLLGVYGLFLLKNYRKESTHQQHHHEDMDRMQKQLLLQNMSKANDQEFCTLCIAYLEKFSTKTGTHSLDSLLSAAGFSLTESQLISKVYYGRGALSMEIRERMMKRIKK